MKRNAYNTQLMYTMYTQYSLLLEKPLLGFAFACLFRDH